MTTATEPTIRPYEPRDADAVWAILEPVILRLDYRIDD